MKKILLLIVLVSLFLISCNDWKDPPDGFIKAARIEQAKKDSIDKLASLKEQPISKQ